MIDPLVPLFRPSLAPRPPLLLDKTEIRLRLVPPIARLIVTRTFTSRETVPIEAVLTMPPALTGEVVHGVEVGIGERRWTAQARPRRRAETAYDGAAVDGNRAILFEDLKRGWRTLSVAGVQPGEVVSMTYESVIALGLTGATVRLCPGVDPDIAAPALPDHLTPRQTSEPHPIILTIEGANEIIVRAAGTDLPPVQQISNAPMMLDIVIPAGFEGKVTDWSADDVRAEMALRMAEQIAALLDGDRPVDRQRVRDLALKGNLLTSETSLVFVGAEGEATGVLPAMRKLALVDAVSSDVQAVPSQVPAVEPAASPLAPDGDVPAPGRARGFAVRWPTVGARPPWHVRLGNWWRNRRPPREVSTDMSHLGTQLRSAASRVLWNQDGVLALRSGDVGHLPGEVATMVRNVAAVEDVRQTATVMNLAADHLAIALLAQAAASAGVASPDLLDQLFPDRLPLPFERLARQLGVSG
ncbi:VIT domain-containing protein [Sphingomonas koreensis]|uniref:VIT domain-containing protein n=1 Tax=Sphingomonas koreensis TaxID=93064 RepID=UPI0013DFF39D|nr:VIT domain-containing protein [Sphingomonas koreensis]